MKWRRGRRKKEERKEEEEKEKEEQGGEDEEEEVLEGCSRRCHAPLQPMGVSPVLLPPSLPSAH